MSARDLDLLVTLRPPVESVEADPLRRLFIDLTTRGGHRIVAVAEPVQHSIQGYLTAANALAAFEEAAVVAVDDDTERGLQRAFAAANSAVLAVNRAIPPRQRIFAGITAAVMTGSEALIGLVPPGQALLIQDRRIYGVPDLATWRPGFMPAGGGEGCDPLGWQETVQPVLRRTSVGRFDQLLLGASAVGRVLATQELTSIADLSAAAVIAKAEDALAAARIDDAYAALITFDTTPAPPPESDPARQARLDEIDRAWHAAPPDGRRRGAFATAPESDGERHAITRDRLHSRMIEWSERVLARGETAPLPLERSVRAATPVGAGSLDRYTPAHFGGLRSSARSIMPRGPRLPISRRSLTVLVVLATIAAALATGYDVQRAQADRQDRQIETVKREIERGQQAETLDEADKHFTKAEHSLDSALDHGAKPAMISEWRAQLASARDLRHGVTRLSALGRIGQLPTAVKGQTPRLLMHDGRLFLIAGSLFEVDAAGQQLLPLIEPGDVVGGHTVATVVDAAVDAGQLVVTDGRSLYAMDARGRWTAEPLADANRPGGWRGKACGAFKGAFYLLDADGGQIRKFAAQHYDAAPTAWLKGGADGAMTSAVDMVVDGSIHVLMADGTIQTYFKGQAHGEPLAVGGEEATPVALFGGTDIQFLYVVERSGDEARLIRVDRQSRSSALYLPPSAELSASDAAASAAFAGLRDFAVDEASGTIFFVTEDALWQARIV